MNFKKNDKKPSLNSSTPMNSINSIVRGTSINGEITSDTDIRIDGIITGNISCNATVIIGETGVVEGDIICTSATVEGRFKGSLIVKETLKVKERAVIEGDISVKQLVVQPGAVFNGNCKMGSAQVSSASNDKMKRSANGKLATSV